MLKAGVVGLGYLGKFHAEKYFLNQKTSLSGLYDIDYEKAAAFAEKYNCKAYKNIEDLYKNIDIVSIVSPASSHYNACVLAVQNGLKVLVEKPFMSNIEDAQYIHKLAYEKNILVQVGFIERFNIAYKNLKNYIFNPIFADFNRLGAYNTRASDVSVIFDLMIHDIDLMLDLIDDSIIDIKASGASLITDKIDIAKATIYFKNKAVVNLSASRALETGFRVAKIKDNNNFYYIDFQNAKINTLNLKNKEIKEETYTKNDSLYDEIDAFIDAENIFTNTLKDGVETVKLASEITDIINSSIK